MKIEYKIKGITLNEWELNRIHNYYEVVCTADYIMDIYNVTDENEAMRIAYEVRERMDKYEDDENEAIDAVMGMENYEQVNEED